MDSENPLIETAVAGADGCPAGWICVVAHHIGDRSELHEVVVLSTFGDLIEATKTCSGISVDMPIGLSETGLRQADVDARRFIGPRRSSVFPPPPRALITADGDYSMLNMQARRIRAGLSKQTYNILAKIREVDAVMTADLQARVRESHPEVSFCALKGSWLQHAKRTREGQQERLDLLAVVYGPTVRDWLPPRGAAMDDLYDAAVLAWTAARVVRGQAQSLPAEPPQDARGLRMEIVY